MAPRQKRQLSRTNNLVASRKQIVKEETSEEFLQKLPIKVETGLGENIDKYVSLSPTLIRQIQKLKDQGWVFRWNTVEGTITDFDKNFKPGRVLIDSRNNPGNRTDFNALMQIKYVTSVLAHEVAHAATPIQYDKSSKEACIRSAMSGPGSEAVAAYNNILVRQEILINNKREDLVRNSGDNWDEMDQFQQIITNNQKQEALDKIGNIYRYHHPSNKLNQTYEQYYGDYCEKIIPVKKRR